MKDLTQCGLCVKYIQSIVLGLACYAHFEAWQYHYCSQRSSCILEYLAAISEYPMHLNLKLNHNREKEQIS
ncbi:uncharacterized protein FA14DRAFT_27801 [Meira miltonrushii]|uniref:Uncharacterized protein n=1 Tax=Meira miltonrushii TaxID=1280837 RepID=A0A316VLT2_9BASI|nr:uncharacterized protein FA14DRAFT_27801 [Meira miltonrushii]PWN38552.1 hypothetical protein FA14DRAFT_27801 [Meira miltonrushii]